MIRRHVIMLAALLAAGVAGCSDSHSAPHGSAVSTAPVAATSAPPSAHANPGSTPSHALRVGDTAKLSGSNGEDLAVALVKVADPATANYTHPSPGMHFVAVELRIANHGGAVWNGNGAPTTFSHIIGADEQQYGPILASTALAQMFTANVVIPAGGETVGAITFQVRDGVKAAAVQIVLDRGSGPSARWQLG